MSFLRPIVKQIQQDALKYFMAKVSSMTFCYLETSDCLNLIYDHQRLRTVHKSSRDTIHVDSLTTYAFNAMISHDCHTSKMVKNLIVDTSKAPCSAMNERALEVNAVAAEWSVPNHTQNLNAIGSAIPEKFKTGMCTCARAEGSHS